MLKFKTSCAVLAYLSSNLLNEVGLSLFRYFEVGLRVWDMVVKKFTSAISSPDEFLYLLNSSVVAQLEALPIGPKSPSKKILYYTQINSWTPTELLVKSILPRDAYAWRAICFDPCLMSVTSRCSIETARRWGGFTTQGLPSAHPTLYFTRIRVYPNIRLLLCGTLSQTLKFGSFSARRSFASVANLVRPSQVSYLERPPSFATH